MSNRIAINPGDKDSRPFLTVNTTLDTMQWSIYVLDVTPEQLHSLADDLEQKLAWFEQAKEPAA